MTFITSVWTTEREISGCCSNTLHDKSTKITTSTMSSQHSAVEAKNPPPTRRTVRQIRHELLSWSMRRTRNRTSQLQQLLEEQLPQIVVVGDTSSGKSTILSNLTGIELPAASTLTTRCPILIQLRHQSLRSSSPATLSSSPFATSQRTSIRHARIQVVWKSSDNDSSSPPFGVELCGDDDARLKVATAIRQAQDHILKYVHKDVARDVISVTICTTSTAAGPLPNSPATGETTTDSTTTPETSLLSLSSNASPSTADDDLEIGQEEEDDTAGNLNNGVLDVGNYDYDDGLTLLDLPGWIHNKGRHESETLVQDVQDLLNEYLMVGDPAIGGGGGGGDSKSKVSSRRRNRRTLLLVAVPANVDYHNSHVLAQVMKLAAGAGGAAAGAAANPTNIQVLPVITKPDLIDPGAESDVLDLLLGKHHRDVSPSTTPVPLLGFRMIKGRGQAQLDQQTTISQGLEDEATFFAQVEPWKSVQDRTMLGTEQLRWKLSQLEHEMICQSFPDILQELQVQQQRVNHELEQLCGSSTHDRMHWFSNPFERRKYYQELCDTFLRNICATSTGKGRRITQSQQQLPSAANQLHQAVSHFTQQIQESSMATLRTITEGGLVLVTTPRGIVKGEVVHLDATFACVDYVVEVDAQSDALFQHVSIPTEELVEENEVWSDGTRVCIARKNQLYDVMRQIPLQNVQTDPIWLRDKMNQYRTDDLACFLNIDVFTSIVGRFVEEEWKPCCLTLVETTKRLLLEALDQSLQQAFVVGNRYPELQLLVSQKCRTVVQRLSSNALQQVLATLETEKHPYTSLHDDLCQQIVAERHARLKRELEVTLRLDQKGSIFETEAIQTIVDRVFERQQKQTSVEEHMSHEMELVLAAYGNVATKRVLDRMPMICWEVVRSIGPSIQSSLWDIPDETICRCMQDSPEFVQRQAQLQEELDEVTKAISMIESIV